MSYDRAFVEYDELSSGPVALGPKCIRCQCCGKEVINRHYIELQIKSDPPRAEKVLAMVRLSHYRRVPMVLSDGSVTHLHMCSKCEQNEDIDISKDKEKCERIINQIKETFKAEDRFHLRPEKDVDENAKRWDEIKAVMAFKHGKPFKDALTEGRKAVDKFKSKEMK